MTQMEAGEFSQKLEPRGPHYVLFRELCSNNQLVAGIVMTLSPRLFPPIRAADGEALTNERRGRSCQLVMVKVTELRLCPSSHASPHWPLLHVLSATSTAALYCTVHLYCVLCCHNRYIPTGSWLQVASYTDASRFYKSQETVFLPSY